MRKKGPAYLLVDLGLVCEYGANAAVFLALLKTIAKKRPRDSGGYVAIEMGYIAAQMGLGRATVKRIKDDLVERGVIEWIAGKNQNSKSRYRLLI